MDVHHRNNNKIDNRRPNLEWVTRSQNIKYVYRDNLRQPVNVKGERNGRCKLSKTDVLTIRDISGKYSYQEIARMFNVSRSLIDKIIRRELWKTV